MIPRLYNDPSCDYMGLTISSDFAADFKYIRELQRALNDINRRLMVLRSKDVWMDFFAYWPPVHLLGDGLPDKVMDLYVYLSDIFLETGFTPAVFSNIRVIRYDASSTTVLLVDRKKRIKR